MTKKIAQFDPIKLSEDNQLYSREDELLQIIDFIPQALEEILLREQETISEILRLKEDGKKTTDMELQLRDRVFFSEESKAEYSDARCFDSFITSYRKDGRNFFRKLAELTLTKYAKMANLEVHEVEKRRYITVLGYSWVNGHLEEKSRALIPVSQFGRVPILSAHLEHRLKEIGRAMYHSDLIYSHHTEEFDEEGFILDEKGKRQTLIQVGEAVMFVRRSSNEEKEKKIIQLVRDVANHTIYSKKCGGNRNFGGIKRDSEFLMDVGEEGKYPTLYEALFDTVARTVSIDDLINNEKLEELKKRSDLGKYLAKPNSNLKRFVNYFEELVSNPNTIAPPIGFVSFGWKGISFAEKLMRAVYHDTITNDENGLRNYLESHGIPLPEKPYSQRDLRDVIRTTFLTWGGDLEPFSGRKALPDRDLFGERKALDLFGYLFKLTREEVEALLTKKTEEVLPCVRERSGRLGLEIDWSKTNAIDNYFGDNMKSNGYNSLNLKPIIPLERIAGKTGVEVVFKTNLADARSYLITSQSHSSYGKERYHVNNWLVNVMKVMSPEEYYALQMLVSPTHEVV